MNRWKGSNSWIWVWGVSFLVGGLILYVGYFGTLSNASQVRVQKMTKEIAQAVTARTTLDTGDGREPLILKTQTGELATTGSQESVPNSSKKDQHISSEEQKLVLGQKDSSERGLDIKDFPSPVQGEPLRKVGNYYSEVLESYFFHAGIDYGEPEGAMIRATHGGKVIFAGLDPILGQKVTLDCGEGWLVSYGGLDNLRVQVGETVETQGALGQVGFFPGAEGVNDQPQLHYEVWHGNEVQTLLPNK